MAHYTEESKAIEESEMRRIKEEIEAKSAQQINEFKRQQESLKDQLSAEETKQLNDEISAIKAKYAADIENYRASKESEKIKLEQVTSSLVNQGIN